MVSVPAGVFLMGSDAGDDDERPQRRVTVAAFTIDRTEVTTRAYAACVAAGACASTDRKPRCNEGVAGRGEHPINCVSFAAATAYCAWRGARLPTETEWEYAARGPVGRTYPWGDARPRAQLCWDGPGNDVGAFKRQGTCPVGSYLAGRSPFGLDDMAGNVWEWTSDIYPSEEGAPADEPLRVSRGGTWFGYDPYDVRSPLRFRTRPQAQGYGIGFRCAR